MGWRTTSSRSHRFTSRRHFQFHLIRMKRVKLFPSVYFFLRRINTFSSSGIGPFSSSYSRRTASRLYRLRYEIKNIRTCVSFLVPITSAIALKSLPYFRTPWTAMSNSSLVHRALIRPLLSGGFQFESPSPTLLVRTLRTCLFFCTWMEEKN